MKTSDRLKACQIIGTWSGVDKPKNLDLVEIFESLLGLDLLPAESVETVVESYFAMRKAMKEALKRN